MLKNESSAETTIFLYFLQKNARDLEAYLDDKNEMTCWIFLRCWLLGASDVSAHNITALGALGGQQFLMTG